MTYSSSGPSLAQAPGVDPSSSSSSFDESSSSSSWSSSASSHSHSHTHSDSHARSIGKRHAHIHRYDQPEAQSEDFENARRSLDSGSQLRHSHQRRLQFRDANTAPKLEIREEQTSGYVTQVVQTVSLVQVVDSTGSPIELQTRYGTFNTVVVDSSSGSTISASDPESSTAAAPASDSAQTNDVAQSTADMTPVQASTPGVDATSSGTDSSQYAAPTPESTSYPVTTPAATSYSVELDTLQDTALTPSHNGTTSGLSTDSSTSVTSQTTLTDTTTTGVTSETTSGTSSDTTSESSMRVEMLSSTTRSVTSSISSFASSSTTSLATTDESSLSYSSTVYSYQTETWTSTQYGDQSGGGGGGDYVGATGTNAAVDPTSTSSSNSTSGTLSTQQKQVIGGVVGSVAGVAMIALLILLAFKYKRRRGDGTLLGGLGGTRTKGLLTGGGGSGSGGAMTERSGPFAVTAALVGLTSKRSSQPSEPAGERGFYRVSGKKLPSVLHNGGDGYSDPRDIQTQPHNNRESVASGHTDYWRGSQAFEPAADGSTRLALGSPMRPVSGVPIIRTGPARTPVTEENPFADPAPRPRPDSDALGDSIAGGSIASQDGSWNSPSRFHERI